MEYDIPTLWGQSMDLPKNKPLLSDAIREKQDDLIFSAFLPITKLSYTNELNSFCTEDTVREDLFFVWHKHSHQFY